MRAVLFLACVLRARGADDLFDLALYRAALDPALCRRQLASMSRAEFYDATFRAPEGLLVGNFASLGNYHQCLAINQDFPGANIQGKYCMIRAPVTPPTVRIPTLTGVSVSENVTWTELTLPEDQMQKYAGESLSLAVCVPKSCAVEAVLAPYAEHPVVAFNYTEQSCRLPDDKPIVAADYVAIIVFSVLGMLTLISTAYELRHTFILRRDPEQASELLRACSLYSNTRRLLTFQKPRPLDCLDGIRSLSILMIVIYHTFCFNISLSTSYVVNSFEVSEWVRKKRGVWMASGDIAVDSFFTLSGLLLVYTSVNKMKQMSLLRNLPWFYLSRFLRLFPLLATALLLQASLMLRLADGPGWQIMAVEVHRCRRYWWSSLLHVQNLINSYDMCLPHTWYLSVDMQLHVMSPLVLFWLLGSRRAACSALAVNILASLVAALALCSIYVFSISPFAYRGLRGPKDGMVEYMQYYYISRLVRAPPFHIGMLFGYILHVHRDQNVKLSQWVTVVCHILSLGTFTYIIYIVHPSLQADWDNQLADIINNAFRRPCWSLALCWLVFACVHGYGGPVNWFLSLRLWKFVARISYAMYLFHPIIQGHNIATVVTPIYFNMEMLFSMFASVLVFTILVSTAACVLVEEPAFALQRMLLRGALKSTQQKNEDITRPEAVAEENKCKRI